ncbi:carboxymuconolactone decarboxylase family protein [Microbacterium pygmaeum]|uniref:4-carboxymuconolactone decarboxylase n=1 Tax=Microbacterium pygmaeum TaxID=370764 RepID=A0A1G7VM86_9MICO|nr:carboxymuconolactone decarboxylase family protein [Microbacterium pygmaeum]SDG60529.1 4-carboxymuconolactone decarboxylase [Microbacterium pygmaeum]
MAPRIRPMPPADLDAEQRALYDAITGGPRASGPQHFALTSDDGALRGPFDAFLLSPAVGGALQGLGAAIRYRTHLTDRQRELAILLVAADQDSAFERESHEAIARAIGFSEAELEAIRVLDVSAFAEDDLAVGSTVVALLDGDLDDARWAAASDSLGAAVVFELTTLVGYYRTLALQLRVFRVGA